MLVVLFYSLFCEQTIKFVNYIYSVHFLFCTEYFILIEIDFSIFFLHIFIKLITFEGEK